MDPTEFDEFDSLLGGQRWDGAFQVGWRVLHRLMRSFFAQLSLFDQKRAEEEQRELLRRTDKADEQELFTKWARKLTSVDIRAEIEARRPSLWKEYERAKELRKFVFHGRIYMEHGYSVQASAQALREMLAFTDQLFEANEPSSRAAEQARPAVHSRST